jgi:hypothetical protein
MPSDAMFDRSVQIGCSLVGPHLFFLSGPHKTMTFVGYPRCGIGMVN